MSTTKLVFIELCRDGGIARSRVGNTWFSQLEYRTKQYRLIWERQGCSQTEKLPLNLTESWACIWHTRGYVARVCLDACWDSTRWVSGSLERLSGGRCTDSRASRYSISAGQISLCVTHSVPYCPQYRPACGGPQARHRPACGGPQGRAARSATTRGVDYVWHARLGPTFPSSLTGQRGRAAHSATARDVECAAHCRPARSSVTHRAAESGHPQCHGARCLLWRRAA